MLQKFFDQVGIELFLVWAEQEGETDRILADDREFDFMHVFEIDKNMIYRRELVHGVSEVSAVRRNSAEQRRCQ